MLEEVRSFELLSDYEIYVELSDGRKGVFDTKPYLDKGVFRELREPSYFRKAHLSLGTIAWPHEQDFAPETIAHDLKPVHGAVSFDHEERFAEAVQEGIQSVDAGRAVDHADVRRWVESWGTGEESGPSKCGG